MCDLVVRADFLQDAGHPCVAFVLLLAVGATGWAFCFLFKFVCCFQNSSSSLPPLPHSVPAAPNLHETNCVLLRDVGSVVLEIMLWGSRA